MEQVTTLSRARSLAPPPLPKTHNILTIQLVSGVAEINRIICQQREDLLASLIEVLFFF